MANNMLYLICRLCEKEEKDDFKERIFLAKYFPSLGWYNEQSDFSQQFEAFLDAHSHHQTLYGLDDEDREPFYLHWEQTAPISGGYRYTPEYIAQLDADILAMELAEQSEEPEQEET